MAGKPSGKQVVLLENSSQEPKTRGKASWDANATKIFIDLCKADVLERNKPGVRLRNPVWKILAPKFNELTKREFEHYQLKNKWDNLRRDWQLWKAVTAGGADMGWVSSKDTVVDDDLWEARLKVVPKAAKFQKRPPDHLDDLEIIFSHTVANGDFAGTPISDALPLGEYMTRENDIPPIEYMTREREPQLLEGNADLGAENFLKVTDAQLDGIGDPDPAAKTCVEHLNAVNPVWTANLGRSPVKHDSKENDPQLFEGSRDSKKENALDGNDPRLMGGRQNSNGGDNIGLEILTAETPTYVKAVGEIDGSKKHMAINVLRCQKEKKVRTVHGTTTLSEEADRICEVVESRSSAKSSATSMMTRSGYSIAEVMELMESMPNIEPASELYMLGTRLFIKRENREMFVALKTPHVRMAWLKQELAREGQSKPND